MKVRLAFISNSSSASFIIKKSALSLEQINAIRSHIQYTKEKELEVQCADPSNQWNIIEDEEKIGGRTTMANFSMWKFLKAINVRLNDVDYDSDEPIDTGTVDDQLNEIIDRKRSTRPFP